MIGDPVEHSLSPRIFARLFAEEGIDGHSLALRIPPSDLAEFLGQMRRGALAGISVTLPHKEAILPHLDDLHPLARRIGAVNCVLRTQEGRLVGFNTDAMGFRLALEEGGSRLAAARVVLLGAGGAARAAVFACASAGAKGLVIANRNPERATALATDLCKAGWSWPEGELLRTLGGWSPRGAAGPSGRCFVSSAPLESAPLRQALLHANVLVNATSVGLGDPLASPLPADLFLPPDLTTLDMVYRPLRTALLCRAEDAGGKTVDGLRMLIHQAAEQFRIWTGKQVGLPLLHELHGELAKESET